MTLTKNNSKFMTKIKRFRKKIN